MTQSSVETLPAQPSKLADLYELTKPRMNMLIVSTTAVGFVMASAGRGLATAVEINWLLMGLTVIGTALTAAAAGVLNQVIERRLDQRMARTADRPVAAGRVSVAEATAFGVVLALLGVAILARFVNPLTALLGLTTLLIYLFAYTPLKTRTSLCTIVGAIPGALPPMMGVTAVTGVLNWEAAALFGILFAWQMPHFYGLAIMYKDDYAAGGFKMLPSVDPHLVQTSVQIVVFTGLTLAASLWPALLGETGLLYPAAAIMLGIAYLVFAGEAAAYRNRNAAKNLFLFSIAYLPLLLMVLVLDKR